MDINIGQVVLSRAGRDKGRKFIVVEISDEMHVLLADGDLRKIEKPKRKKIKHIILKAQYLDAIGVKLKEKQKVTNSEIRRILLED